VTSAGTSGRLYLTTDYGATWTPKTTPPSRFAGIESLFVDPEQPDTLVSATPDGFYRSTDGAVTWTTIKTPWLGGGSYQHFAYLPSACRTGGTLFTIAGSRQVYASFDFGATWQTSQRETSQLSVGFDIAVT